MNRLYCELDSVKKINPEVCAHLILEKEIPSLGCVPVWRCIFCDTVVKLKKIKNGLQKKFQK